MKQILQDLQRGDTLLVDVPAPAVSKGCVLIRTTRSLISVGTERMLFDFGKASLLGKARQQPEKVKMVIDKIKTDGLFTTLDAVHAKLAKPIPLGYSNVGVVLEVGSDVGGLKPGDRVVSNGPHAEIVIVPKNLCVKIPDNVDDDSAAFTILASIGLQGLRLARPELGETFVVTGAGLIGLLTIQLLHAFGCRVLAIDFDDNKLALAKDIGAYTCNPGKGEDPVARGIEISRGKGVDGVIITAATNSDEPVSQAAKMLRKRGRIILVGVTGLKLNRADFYEKEISFQVSCSYGPGRYDTEYEDKGNDYPYGFVRWTEQRNFEAVLDMLSENKLDVSALISHYFEIDDAAKAYAIMAKNEPVLGILLKYPGTAERNLHLRTITLDNTAKTNKTKENALDKACISFIGAGNYATALLIPAFSKSECRLRYVSSNGGVSCSYAGKKFGFEKTTTDIEPILEDQDTNTIVITTRHNSHAKLVTKALLAGKHVFVEKPLCLTIDELAEIESTYRNITTRQLLMVGFNRRFSPQIQKIKSLLNNVHGYKSFVMTVNAGDIPENHWTQDEEIGGGRIIGEVCHFIDLLRYLAASDIETYQAIYMDTKTRDTVCISLKFSDGSVGTINYFSNGHKSLPKERLEVFASGRVLQLDNFRKLKAYGWPGFKKMNLWRQDKGQVACVAAFIKAIESGTSAPISVDEIFQISRITIELANQT